MHYLCLLKFEKVIHETGGGMRYYVCPQWIIDKIKTHLLLQNPDESLENFTLLDIREALNNIDICKYYLKDAVLLFGVITGKPIPTFTTHQKNRLKERFLAIQRPFEQHKQAN